MKLYLKSAEYIAGMATINPKLCNSNNIVIKVMEQNEGPYPHVHVYWDKTLNPRKCSCISLVAGEYSKHHKPARLLPPEVKSKFLEIMNSPWKTHHVQDPAVGLRPASGYEAAVEIWCDAYEVDFRKFTLDENGLLVMPNYKNLKTKKY